MIKSILENDGSIQGASVLLNGQYGINDVFIGVPVKLGKDGIEEIIELELDEKEKENLIQAAVELKKCTISV